MNAPVDFQKPVETIQALMTMQAETIGKSLELQKKSGEELIAFFQAEVEKARELKNPQEVVQFNVDANTALFNLLKSQGEAYAKLATDAGSAAMAKLQALAK